MKRHLGFVLLCLSALACAQSYAADAKKDDKDPLAQFSDENLVKIDFCFEKFCAAIAAKDAKLAAAFVADLPRELAKLDLSKDADKAKFITAYASFAGAQIVSSQRMPIGGIGEVTYRDKSGKEKTQRMQNVGGRWKLAQ